jgi:hypothetical protein
MCEGNKRLNLLNCKGISGFSEKEDRDAFEVTDFLRKKKVVEFNGSRKCLIFKVVI